MSNAVMYMAYRLVEGASVPDFLLASEKVEREFMSKQKGYVSWKQLVDGETWADLLTWESKDDAQKAMEVSCSDASTHAFSAFIEPESVKEHIFAVERDYRRG